MSFASKCWWGELMQDHTAGKNFDLSTGRLAGELLQDDLSTGHLACKKELRPLNRSIGPRNPDGNWAQQVQNWSRGFHDGKWLEIACFRTSVFFPSRVVFPRFSRKKNRATLSQETEPTLSVSRLTSRGGGLCS